MVNKKLHNVNMDEKGKVLFSNNVHGIKQFVLL